MTMSNRNNQQKIKELRTGRWDVAEKLRDASCVTVFFRVIDGQKIITQLLLEWPWMPDLT